VLKVACDAVPAVEVTGLTVRYGPAGTPAAVDGIDLRAHDGEVLVVLGPNGAGKTSTVETLEGYRRPSGGHVRVLGLDPTADHAALSGRVGVMLQRGGVYPMLGPARVLRLFAGYYRDPVPADELLDLVGLRAVAATPWRHLSGGEQQRLSLALALVGRPEVAFLDEPTAGVDPEGRLAVRAVVAGLRAQGVCVVLTTHELGEAEKMADRIVILSGGRVALEGAPQDLTGAAGVDGALVVTFGAPAALDVGALATAIGSGATATETAAGRYRVEAPGAETPLVTAAVANFLAARGAALTDLVVGRTLEDLYFETVGAAAASAPDGTAADAAGTGRSSRSGRSGRSGRSRSRGRGGAR
jgi:ABC-2 type transport system ATP-binding protein